MRKLFVHLIVIISIVFGPWTGVLVAAQAMNGPEVNVEEVLQDENTGGFPNWLEGPEGLEGTSVHTGISYWGIMAFLLALLLLSLWVFNRLSKKAVPASGVGIRVLARHYLSPRSFLCVVEIDGERLLLGVSDSGGVSLISYLDHGQGFREVIRKEMNGGGTTSIPQTAKQEYDDFIRELEGQLKDLKAAIQKRISDV